MAVKLIDLGTNRTTLIYRKTAAVFNNDSGVHATKLTDFEEIDISDGLRFITYRLKIDSKSPDKPQYQEWWYKQGL
jgi:hypothetical protein